MGLKPSSHFANRPRSAGCDSATLVRDKRRFAWVQVAFFAVLPVSWGVACSPGQVYLSSGESEPTTELLGTGGAGTGGMLGTGGQVSEVPDEPTGEEDPQDNPPHSEEPPCSLRDECSPLCKDDPEHCLPCENSVSCSSPFPHCDEVQESCVECLDGDDCQGAFGADFPACSAGRCVQCQRDDHCHDGLTCAFGWCVECRKNYDCDVGEVCYELRCVPELLPPPLPSYPATGGSPP